MRRLLALLLLSAAPSCADGITDLRRSCFQRDLLHHAQFWLAECIQELFSIEPVHLAIGSVEPGAGSFAYGLGLTEVQRLGQFEFLGTDTIVRSTDGSFLIDGGLTIALPTMGFTHVDQGMAPYGSSGRWSVPTSREVDGKASITFKTSRLEAKEQDFYGLGNQTQRTARSGYSLRLNDFGVLVNDPLYTWASVGFQADFLQPRVGLSSDTNIPQVRAAFGEAGVPGLGSYNDFARFGPNVNILFPPRRSTYFTLGAGYQFYHSIDDAAQYSFRRLNVSGQLVYHLRAKAQRRRIYATEKGVDAKERVTASSWTKNAICESERSGKTCTFGDLYVLTSAALSYTGGKSQVPFYFQDTLGGANFENSDTLRGYADYRFRGPDLMLGQLEYRHPIWGPIGFLAFYDIGKVGLVTSDLSFDHLHHDWGVGLYARIGNREVARIYLGLGTGEGIQLHPKLGTVY
jgi:hypothetical protein